MNQGCRQPWMDEADAIRRARPKGILFLCVANSARSQMAEGIARSLAPAGVEVFSAGSRPHKVSALAIQVLDEIGLDISDHWSKPIDEVPADLVDAVVTLCGDEVCPAWLGDALRVQWGLPDPAGPGSTPIEGFRATRDEIRRRLMYLFEGWTEQNP